jgi:hypothetical protein
LTGRGICTSEVATSRCERCVLHDRKALACRQLAPRRTPARRPDELPGGDGRGGLDIVAISLFLEPWGHYGAHAEAELTDGNGKRLERIFLESADIDQPLFAKQNPAAAAKGLRAFSLDGTSTRGRTARVSTPKLT